MDRSDGALLAGVCSGVASRLDWNVWVLRALFVAFLLLKTLWAVAAYAALALVFHFLQDCDRGANDEAELASPEQADRKRRNEELEKRFRDLEKE